MIAALLFAASAALAVLARGPARLAALATLGAGLALVLVAAGGAPFGLAVAGAVPLSLGAAWLVWREGDRHLAAALAALAAAFALSVPSPTLVASAALDPLGSPWALPHLVLALAASAALLVATAPALRLLQQEPAWPLGLSAALTLLLWLTPAGAVVGLGAPAPVEIMSAEGGAGLVRVVRAAWLWDGAWLRAGALALLGAGLFFALRRRAAGAPSELPLAPPALGWLVALLLLAPFAASLLGWAQPGPLLGNELDTLEVAVGTPGAAGVAAPQLVVAVAAAAFALAGFNPGSAAPPLGRSLDLAALLMTLAALTGMLWSNYVWGAFWVNDPRLFGTLVIGGLLGLAIAARAGLPTSPSTHGLLVCLATLVWLWMVVGPSLGWTAPTLHDFGG